jgi:signal transduction histidine kinase
MNGKAILLIGDLPENGLDIARALDSWGCEVDLGFSSKSARRALNTKEYALLICYTTRASQQWLEIIREAARLLPDTRIMLMSAHHQEAWPVDAFEMEIADYFVLPASSEELYRRVSRCLHNMQKMPARSSFSVPVEYLDKGNSRLLAIFHDFRSAMVSNAAIIKLLSRGKYGDLPESAVEKTEEAHVRMHKLIRMSEDFISQVLLGLSGEEQPDGDEIRDLRRDVIEPILAESAEDIRDRNILIANRLNFSQSQAVSIKGSRTWLRSVFRNLLKNAIEYGGRGCTITIELKGQNGAHYLHVCNTGQPIPKARQALLFSRFSQRPRRCGTDSKGLKLGLSLSQEIMRQLGGDLWYEPWSQGSDFVVMLPSQERRSPS